MKRRLKIKGPSGPKLRKKFACSQKSHKVGILQSFLYLCKCWKYGLAPWWPSLESLQAKCWKDKTTNRLQDFILFCMKRAKFSTGGSKTAEALRRDLVRSSVTTGGLQLITNPGMFLLCGLTNWAKTTTFLSSQTNGERILWKKGSKYPNCSRIPTCKVKKKILNESSLTTMFL